MNEGIEAFAEVLANACLMPLPELFLFNTQIESYGNAYHYTTNPSDPHAPELTVSNPRAILSHTWLSIDRVFFSQHFLPPDEDLEKAASYYRYEIPNSILNALPFGDNLFWYDTDVLGKKVAIYIWMKSCFGPHRNASQQERVVSADPLIKKLIELYPDLNTPAVYDFNSVELTKEIDQRIQRDHGRAFFEDLLYACHIQPKDWRIAPLK